LSNKWRISLVILTSLVVLLMNSCSSSAAAKPGDTVKVDYTGKFADGTVFDSSIGKTPIEFTVGTGQMIKGFDSAVLGMKVGQSKTVVLPSEEAYGPRDEALMITVEKSRIDPDVTPIVGQLLRVTRADGSSSSLLITAVTASTVTLDGNNPMAGKTLTFDIKLVAITPKK
jgi:peptidylprolyl isomerase